MFASTKSRVAVGVVLLALVLVPAPLLPPLGFVQMINALLGLSWKVAYFLCVIGLQTTLFGSLGVISAFAVGPGEKPLARWSRLVWLPVVVVGVALLIRVAKLGHWPMLPNVIVPVLACVVGVVMGLLFRQHGWRVTLAAIGLLLLGLVWASWPGQATGLSRATEMQLQRIVAASPQWTNASEPCFV